MKIPPELNIEGHKSLERNITRVAAMQGSKIADDPQAEEKRFWIPGHDFRRHSTPLRHVRLLQEWL